MLASVGGVNPRTGCAQVRQALGAMNSMIAGTIDHVSVSCSDVLSTCFFTVLHFTFACKPDDNKKNTMVFIRIVIIVLT